MNPVMHVMDDPQGIWLGPGLVHADYQEGGEKADDIGVLAQRHPNGIYFYAWEPEGFAAPVVTQQTLLAYGVHGCVEDEKAYHWDIGPDDFTEERALELARRLYPAARLVLRTITEEKVA